MEPTFIDNEEGRLLSAEIGEHVTPREEVKVITDFIENAFTLNDNDYVADRLNKDREISQTIT